MIIIKDKFTRMRIHKENKMVNDQKGDTKRNIYINVTV